MNRSIMAKVGIIALIFILAVTFICINLNQLLVPDTYIGNRWVSFYKQPNNSVDILVLGSSHAFSSFNTNIMEEELDKSVYLIASHSQDMKYAYYCLEEALKTQNPELIVLEAFSIVDNRYEAAHYGQDKHKWKYLELIEGMKVSPTKVKFATKVCEGEKETIKAIFPIIKYRRDITNFDKIQKKLKKLNSKETVNDKGYNPAETVMSEATAKNYETYDYSYDGTTIPEVEVEYFHKFVKLCEKEDIPLLLVKSPMYSTFVEKSNYYKKHNLVKELADKYNLEFIDYNIGENKLDIPMEGFGNEYHAWHHMNDMGASIMTKEFVNTIKTRY